MQRPHHNRGDISFHKRILFLGRNSGIHGLGHLFEKNANFLARLFWLAILLVSSGCLYQILEHIIEGQTDEEVTFTSNTLYLPWTTTFPAVTICEIYNSREAERKLIQKYPKLMESLNINLRKYVTDLLYAKGACKKSLCVPCGTTIPCDLPWRKIIEDIHKTCDELVSECSYNGVEFSCCSKFRAVDSENGLCYAFNSLMSGTLNKEPLFSVNTSTGPGVVSFRLSVDTQVSVHSNEELSTGYLDPNFKFLVSARTTNRETFLFSLVETENDPLLLTVDTKSIGCRYLHQVLNMPFYTYKVYSYGACHLARNTELQYEQCGCVHPIRDQTYKDKYCNFTGLNCLVNLAGQLSMNEEDCLQSCVESELTKIHITRSWVPEEPGRGAVVNIQMAALPTMRYQRNLMDTGLDVVVSIGGIVGLFFSASVLSLVEIFYLFLRKPSQ